MQSTIHKQAKRLECNLLFSLTFCYVILCCYMYTWAHIYNLQSCVHYIFALLFKPKTARMTLLIDPFSENTRHARTDLTNVKLMML